MRSLRRISPRRGKVRESKVVAGAAPAGIGVETGGVGPWAPAPFERRTAREMRLLSPQCRGPRRMKKSPHRRRNVWGGARPY